MKAQLADSLLEGKLHEEDYRNPGNADEPASEEDVEKGLGFILDNAGTLETDEGGEYRISQVRSFQDVGMMSNSRGLTFRVGDREFALTIQAR